MNRKPRPLTSEEFEKYKKYFKGGSVMNGMQLSDFLKKIAAGDEIEFVFHNKTYFYQGYYENDQYVSTVDCWDEEHKSEFDGYIYEHRTTVISERLLAFEEAKIFDGKTIFDVENEIEVIFG